MVKPAIKRSTISTPALERLLSQYGLARKLGVEPTPLAGGFSGTNYKVLLADGSKVCLKICHGYDRNFVESQAKVQDHLASSGFRKACFAIPLQVTAKTAIGDYSFAAVDPDTGDPCLALTFLEGRAADAILETGILNECQVLFAFGAALAEMHSVDLGKSQLRHYSKGGACDVQKHVDGSLWRKMKGSEFTRDHPFVTKFYEKRCASLIDAMMNSNSSLPQGILHGDPFLDNALINETNGTFSGFVDFEDACSGPLLFDVACSVIGTCFPEGSSDFDVNRFDSLMRGYTSVRRLVQPERHMFVAFARLSLLCNCTWRFINFQIDNRDVIECRERYRELQDRIFTLESALTVNLIEDKLQQLESQCARVAVTDPQSQQRVMGHRVVLGALALGAVATMIARYSRY